MCRLLSTVCFLLILSSVDGVSSRFYDASAAAQEHDTSPRIVSIGGAVTEIIYALGAGAQLVGVDTSSIYPEIATTLSQVGYQRVLSVEGVLSLTPSLVIATAEAGPPAAIRQLKAAGVNLVLVPNAYTVTGVHTKIRLIAQALGCEARGEDLVYRLDNDLAKAQEALRYVRSTPKVLFIYARGQGNMNVAGSDTSADAMIHLAGGVNVITDYTGYKPLTAEALAAVSPDVLLEGQHLHSWPRRERAQIMAVLSQQATLVFPFTVLDVVLMGRTPHLRGAETANDYTIARAALKAAGMLAYAHRIYPTLSGGERHRVQFARVLAQVWEVAPARTRYLLLDEPTSNLDLAYQQSTLETARQFARQETGVLTILHDLNLAAQFADRMVVLKDGRQLAIGCPHEVLTPTIIQAAFAVGVTVIPHPRLPCPLVVPVP